MNKRTVKELLVGLALGGFVGGLMLIKSPMVIPLNGPVFLLSLGLNSWLAYIIFSIIYWAYLGVMFVVLIDLKKIKLLLFIVVSLIVLHLIVIKSLQGALG
ncbi:hypothetical protein GF369_00940 [Candidatus Peregrinibacteria bacterium]|nr:hypothetical protein [Candidatus Peregrinibacteria bacterium]